mgnify:CR=1 FL=1
MIVPRSFIAELLDEQLAPWVGDPWAIESALDLCTGSGCIAIAMAHYNPEWHVDGVDISDDALALSAENKVRLHTDNVRFVKSDLFSGLSGEHYQLIVTNPPYGVRIGERRALLFAALAEGLGMVGAGLSRSVLALASAVLVMGVAGSVFGLARHAYLTEVVPAGISTV